MKKPRGQAKSGRTGGRTPVQYTGGDIMTLKKSLTLNQIYDCVYEWAKLKRGHKSIFTYSFYLLTGSLAFQVHQLCYDI